MNDMLQQLMNMIENTRTIPAASVLDDALWIYHWSRSWIRSSLFWRCD